MTPAPLGQHFLINKNVAAKMVDLLESGSGPVLEIGPGKGVLTRLLVEKPENREIILVELDRELAGQLKKKYRHCCTVIRAGILDIQLRRLSRLRDITLVGNIPYYLSKDLIDWTIRESEHIKTGLYMMQKEFVDKLMGGTNSRSLMFGYVFNREKKFNVRPGSFSPPPAVMSTVFRFEKKTDLPCLSRRRAFHQFLRWCFQSRRKTLMNNLSHHFEREMLSPVFRNLDLDPESRSEQLGLPDFLALYRGLENQKRPDT